MHQCHLLELLSQFSPKFLKSVFQITCWNTLNYPSHFSAFRSRVMSISPARSPHTDETTQFTSVLTRVQFSLQFFRALFNSPASSLTSYWILSVLVLKLVEWFLWYFCNKLNQLTSYNINLRVKILELDFYVQHFCQSRFSFMASPLLFSFKNFCLTHFAIGKIPWLVSRPKIFNPPFKCQIQI